MRFTTIEITARVKLPCCGAEVEQSVTRDDAPLSAATDALRYWFESRAEKHQCSLVSLDNVMGAMSTDEYKKSTHRPI